LTLPPFSLGEEVAGETRRMRARGRSERRREAIMKTLKVGEITITSLIEREGPWRKARGYVPGL
jgi:hypothetical protein